MAEETIRVNYLIEAVDNATKTMERIEQTNQAMIKSLKESDKAVEKTRKSNRSLLSIFSNLTSIIENTTSTLFRFYNQILNFDFQKLTRILIILGTIAKFKGLDGLASVFFNLAKQVDFFGFVIDGVDKKVKKLQESYGSLTGAFLEITGLNKVASIIGGMIKNVGLLGAAFIGLSSSTKIISFMTKSVIGLEDVLLKFDYFIVNAFGGENLNLIQRFALTLSDKLFRGVVTTRNAMTATNTTLNTAYTTLKTTKNVTEDVGGAFLRAATQTEVFQKGLFATVAKISTAAFAISGLGKLLAESDNTFFKLGGVTLLAVAAAFGGLAVVIRSFIIDIGNLVQSIGTKLVSAMQESVKTMAKVRDNTYLFGFVINNLNKQTKGATGSMEEWNNVIDQFTRKTGFSVSETQKSVSELLRFGESIGLTKDQMQELLPVIADLAEANHKDLFTSTLAVVEALNGQTVMLQNMGVNLTQHALKETQAGHAIRGKVKSLSVAQQVQLRYNALLEKTKTVSGIAESSVNTLSGALRRQESAWLLVSAALGKGAAVVESQVLLTYTDLLEVLQKLSEPVLNLLGFFGAMLGRLLELAGAFIKWSFAIVLVVTSLKALDTLLKSLALREFLRNIAASTFLTERLAGTFPILSRSIRLVVLRLARSGASIKSLMGLLGTFGNAFITAIAPVLLIAGKIILVIAAIALTVKIVKDGIMKLEEQTKFFSNAWQSFATWWNSAGIMNIMKEQVDSVTRLLKIGLIYAIYQVSIELVTMGTYILQASIWWDEATIAISNFISNSAFLQKVIVYVQILGDFIYDLGVTIKDSFIKLWDDAIAAMSRFGSFLVNNLGVTSAYAQSLADLGKESDNLSKTNDGLSRSERKAIASKEERIRKNDELIQKLAQLRDAEIDGLDKVNQARDTASLKFKASEEEKLSFMQFINDTNVMEARAAQEETRLARELANEDFFTILEENLGREAAIRETAAIRQELAEINKIEDTIKREEALTKLKIKAIGIREKAEKSSMFAVKKFEELTAKERLANTQSSLSTISSLTSSSNKELFAIGKAAAIANATISMYTGIMKAWELGPILGPILAPLVAIAGAVNIAKIASQQPPALYNSGIVNGPTTGDQTLVRANGGEVFLNKSDQRNLLDQARYGQSANSDEVAQALNNLAEAIRNQPVSVQIDQREIARAVRREKESGFQL